MTETKPAHRAKTLPPPETADPRAANREAIERIGKLPRDVGWLLFGVGFAGFVAPGIFGLPFMLAGCVVLWPGSEGRLRRWMGADSPKAVQQGMKQIVRFLDDLERRYPGAGEPDESRSKRPATDGAKAPPGPANSGKRPSSNP